MEPGPQTWQQSSGLCLRTALGRCMRASLASRGDAYAASRQSLGANSLCEYQGLVPSESSEPVSFFLLACKRSQHEWNF